MFDKLYTVFRKDQVLTSKEDLLLFNYDASFYEGNSLCVIRPESIEQIRYLVLLSKRYKYAITVRGSGTSLTGASTPINSIILDMSYFNKIKKVNTRDKWVEVESFVTVDKLNEILLSKNLFFPIIPSSHSVATIGGMVATNASGYLSYKYGNIDSFVLGLEYVDGNGRTYFLDENTSFSDLIGSEGTFAIITKIKLSLINNISKKAMLYYEADNNKKILDKIKFLKNCKYKENILSIEYMSKLATDTMEKNILFSEFNVSNLEISEIVEEKKSKNILLLLMRKFSTKDDEPKEEPEFPWNITNIKKMSDIKTRRENCASNLYAKKFTIIEDPKIPEENHEKFLNFCEENNIPVFGHIGTGIFHPHFRINEREKINSLYKLIEELNGKVSGEHGIGIEKKEYFSNKDKINFYERKKKYDPENILNPGKVIDFKNK